MTCEVPGILRLYLSDDIDFDALEDRLLPLAFNPQNEEERDMVDLVFAEFYCVRDGTSSEPLFKERISELSRSQQNNRRLNPEEPTQSLPQRLSSQCGERIRRSHYFPQKVT